MDAKTEIECKKLIHKYYFYKQTGRKIKIRNKLYCIMSGDMQMWIKNILKRWGRYEIKEEIISISFDAFLFCLERYSIEKESSLSKFFYDATRYFLLMKYAKKDKVRLPAEELHEILKIDNTPINNVFDNLLTIAEFRDCLTNDKEKLVWDDAFMSLCDRTSDKTRTIVKNSRYGTGIEDSAYRKLKKVFISQIKLIMNVKDKIR